MTKRRNKRVSRKVTITYSDYISPAKVVGICPCGGSILDNADPNNNDYRCIICNKKGVK